MTSEETLVHAREMLEREGRVAYRILKRQLELDDDEVEDLKADLIETKQVAVDEDGKVLVWAGGKAKEEQGDQGTAETGERAEQPLPPPQVLDVARSVQEAERRQLTVMFCDLVDSTALSEHLDPEELRELVRAYQQTSAAVIKRYEGHIAQYLGDGLLVYFGYPTAHDDDAARAGRAGLELIEALHQLNTRGATPLRVRIGIHTGLVVVGGIGGGATHEQLAIGATPNIAARMQGQAEPDTVVISAATYRLVRGLFVCEELGRQHVKGLSTPLSLYRVVGESVAQSRFEVTVSAGLTPLVGRDLEAGLLRERWAQAKGGEGQVVLLSGEAGIGKSRLVQTLKELVTAEGATRIEFRCFLYHQTSALYPIIMHLRRLLQLQQEESPQAQLEKLQHMLAHYRFPQDDTVPLLAALLSLPLPAGTSLLTLSPQKQKQKTQEALVAWLVEEAGRRAVYCGWKDLHWADPSTLELLTLFLDQLPVPRLLAVLTFRPEFIPPWRPRPHVTQLTLHRLGHQPVKAMIEGITGGKPLPLEVVQQIVAKTDGVPLFVEELTKMVLESGLLTTADDHYELSGPFPPLAIPNTLHDSLTARLDGLASAKEVAQLGATLGRKFSYQMLQAVSPLGETRLRQALAKLMEAGVLYQRGQRLQARYIFKHALIQDAAYQSLLKSTRHQYHGQIAQVLEERFPATTETQPELVAHHYTEAGLFTQAISYWLHAGERATQRLANVEAITHFTTGLDLLKTLPDTPERTQLELKLQIALGVPLMATEGYAAPGVERAYARARQLCQQVGKTPQLFPVLRGLSVFYLLRAELQTADELGEQLLTLAQSEQESALLVEAHYTLGATLFFRGEPARARTHLEQCILLYDPERHGSHAFLYGQDPGVFAHIVAALALWVLGYGDRALERIREALLAQGVSHQFSLAGALHFSAWLHQLRREGPETQAQAEALITLAREQGFPFWMAWGMVLRGWALAEQGQEEEGIAQMRQGLSGLQATGAALVRPYIIAILAQAYGEVGQPEEGLSVLAEALSVAHKTGERWCEAEVYRLKGQLTLQKFYVSGRTSQVPNLQHVPSSSQAEAEECFSKAIETARRRSAKSLELRAVISLARLWQQQGKNAEAHHLLSETYGWFTEGFDTKDLLEAKALLEELS